MKKISILIISILVYLLTLSNVYAKDTVYSLNKYKDEKFTIIKDSYSNSGKKDGFVASGSVLKETIEEDEEIYNDYQVILVKYNKDGKVKWTFTYGKNKEDNIDYLDYTYDEIGNVDGYLIVMEKTYDVVIKEENIEQQSTTTSKTIFVKVGLDGKLVWEKESNLNNYEKVTKIIPIIKEDNIKDGYIAIANIIKDTKKEATTLIKYDKELNVVWSKEYKNSEYTEVENLDITSIYEENNLVNLITIRKLTRDKENTYQIVKYDIEGNEIKVINDNLVNLEQIKLEEADNGFILYGITSEVKLKKGEKSYFLTKYNKEDEEEWETLGTTATDSKKKIVLVPIKKENKIVSYFIMYNNKIDSSSEVVKINNEGIVEKKVKKIKNDYYDFESFYTENDILYLVGQINCPEDDNCEYDSNSLFLISDEDKVIEVEEDDNTNIVIIAVFGIVILITTIIIHKKRKLKP